MLATKLAPPRTSEAALRPDLIDAVAGAAARKLLLVGAPAGYGKTTVLAAVAKRLEWRVAWYRLDRLDHDPCALIASLTEAVRRVIPGFAEALLARLNAGDGQDPQLHELLIGFVSALVDEVAGDLFIVLDDLHEAGAAHDLSFTLDYLLANLPANVHVVVLTRGRPAFATAKLRLAGELADIDHARLRLDRAQVEHLLRRRGAANAAGEQAELLLRFAEGWPAGIALALERLAPGDAVIADALADSRLKQDLHSYFTEQVLVLEDDATRRFLRDTCCLDPLTVDLADRLAGMTEASRHLDHLVKDHVFTFARGDGTTVHYHRLFRAFLRDRCVREDGPAFFKNLQIRTAKALRAIARFDVATELYLSADYPAAALSTLVRGGEATIENCHTETLGSWLARLPSDLPRRDAWARLLEGQILMREGRHDEALALFSAAEGLFEKARDRWGLYQTLSLTECALFWKGDESAAADCCRRALACAPGDEQRLHTRISLAFVALNACDWKAADRVWSRAAEIGSTSAREQARIACQRVAALTLRGDFKSAGEQGRRELPHLAAAGLLSMELPFHNFLAIVEIHGGEYALAGQHLCRCLNWCDRYGYPHVRRMAEGTSGLLEIMGGRLEQGIDLIMAAAHDPTLAGDVACRAYSLSHVATAWRREGDLERALCTYDEALALPHIESFPAVHLNCLANREFTRLRAGGDADPARLRTIEATARRRGLRFVELKCAFFRGCLAVERGGDAVEAGLATVVARQLELGHASFLSHELTIVPDVAAALLGQCPRATAAGLLDVLTRHWNPLPMSMKALTVSEPVAVQALQAAAAGLAEEDVHKLARRARRSRYPAVRRLAVDLLAPVHGGTDKSTASLPELTPREAEVLGLIASGRSNAELAAQLCLSPATIKTHINHIFSKLGVRDRVHAIIVYRKRMTI